MAECIPRGRKENYLFNIDFPSNCFLEFGFSACTVTDVSQLDSVSLAGKDTNRRLRSTIGRRATKDKFTDTGREPISLSRWEKYLWNETFKNIPTKKNREMQ